MEYAANAFAAELVMPHRMSGFCRWTPAGLAAVCNVSREAAGIRIRDWYPRHPS